jgi:protein gp37
MGLAEVLNWLAGDEEDEIDEEPVGPPKFVTLDDWNTLKDRDRKRLFKTTSEDRFNAQDNDNIEWALWSWNPITGCLHNCPYCYARDIAERFYEQKFKPSFWPGRLNAPRNTPFPEQKAAEWMGHKNVFVCSMADLFGRWVPSEWIEAVLAEVEKSSQWNFLFLTKFPIRLAEFTFPGNAWVGTTVDCQARVANAEKAFRKVKAGVKWLSCEPLIEPLRFSDIGAFDWIVVGGSSKSTQTPEWKPPREWVENIEHTAKKAGLKVYEKTNLLDRIREYPGMESSLPTEAPEELRYLPRDVS